MVEAERSFSEARAADAGGRHSDAVELLRQACKVGHPGALSYLGARLLIGRAAPLSPTEGLEMLRRAAERDEADAHLILATMAAASACSIEAWGPALDHLERAAELGSSRAQGQLRLLSGYVGAPPADPSVWKRLRRSVALAAWASPPPKRIVSEAPRIRVIERFLPPDACDWLIQRARPLLRPATVYDPAGGGARREGARTNSAVEFDIVNADLVMILLRERMARATSLPSAAMEPVQVLHYEPGQRFAPHFDFLDPAVEGYARDLKAGGQRIATFLIYLNDDYEGGETAFPHLHIRHRGRRGDALFFANVDHDHQPDRRTLHAGEAPTTGEKWLLSQWIRDRVGPRVT